MRGISENVYESYQSGDVLGSIENELDKHNKERLEAINLIVSENRMSERSMAPLSSDIQSRYAASFYAGTESAQKIIYTVTELAKKTFKAKYANISPISGNISLLGVIFALTKYKDCVARVPPFFPGGGYPLDYGSFERTPLSLPFSDTNWQLDLPESLKLLDKYKPPLVVLGSSIVTYPMPVNEIAEFVHKYGGIVAYDGSHTLGLIAGGQYQDPLLEGADILLGSTHKTFPGPQGGIILTNDERLHKKVEKMVNLAPLNGPTLICNPHLARIASTGIVLEETKWNEYAKQIVSNARTIAYTLRDHAIPMRGFDAENFSEPTYCHQVLTSFSVPDSIKIRDKLHKHHINVDGFVRIGTSEITRLGFKEEECKLLGNILATIIQSVIKNNNIIPSVDKQIHRLIKSYHSVVL